MKGLLIEKADKVEKLLKQVANSLAVNTNYATMVSAPKIKGTKIKFIQLSKMEQNRILAVIVADGNIIKNQIIEAKDSIDDEVIFKLNMLLNTSLNGLSVDEINLAMISKLKEQAGEYSDIVSDIIDTVSEVIKPDDDLEIYTSGAKNIFKYPELTDKESVIGLITAFEEKKQLTEIVNETMLNDEISSRGIQVYIGDEAPTDTMKDCSVVTATYEIGEGMKGTIGIIGPKRMDYDKVVKTLKSITGQLDSLYKKKE